MEYQRRRLIFNPATGKFDEISTYSGKELFWKEVQPNTTEKKEKIESNENYYDQWEDDQIT